MTPKALAEVLENRAQAAHSARSGSVNWVCRDAADATDPATCAEAECRAAVAAVAYLRQPDLVIARLTLTATNRGVRMTMPAELPPVHVAHDGLGSIADIGRYVNGLALKALPIPEQIEVSPEAWKTLNDEMNAMTRFTPKPRFMGHEEPPSDRTVGRHDIVINTGHGRIRVTVRS